MEGEKGRKVRKEVKDERGEGEKGKRKERRNGERDYEEGMKRKEIKEKETLQYVK